MRVRVNGEDHDIPEGTTVTALLALLKIVADRVAVERNRLVVKRATYEHTHLLPGDEIEILTFVGGGS